MKKKAAKSRTITRVKCLKCGEEEDTLLKKYPPVGQMPECLKCGGLMTGISQREEIITGS